MADADDPFPEPDLPDEVFTELGRLTMAAVQLEDVAYVVCRSIKPRHGLWNDCPIGTHIGEALQDLATCPPDEMRTRAEAWLSQARDALEARNSVLHAVPVTFVTLPGTTPIPGTTGQWLTHFPRDKSRPMIDTPLTIKGLRPLRQRLQRAMVGWVEIVTHPWACYPGNKGVPPAS